MRNPSIDYRQAKRQVRKLVKSGLTKREIAKTTGVSYAAVLLWTLGTRFNRGRKSISGLTLRILKDLVSKGYAFPDGSPQAHQSYSILKKNFPVKRASMHGMTVFFLEGKERKAMEAFLERRNFKSLTWGKISYIRKVFGIKKMKREINLKREAF